MNRHRRWIVAFAGMLVFLSVSRARSLSQSSRGQLVASEPKTRAAAMRETMEVIRGECQRSAGGDWDRWTADLAAVRADLVTRINAVKPRDPNSTGFFRGAFVGARGRDQFFLFEPAPHTYLPHVVEPASLDPFRNDEPVVAGTRWLERQGIDVIFVPVPKMTEIYPEYFTDHCPDDRIIAPHLRQTILELLEADVEVVDALVRVPVRARFKRRAALSAGGPALGATGTRDRRAIGR